MTCRDTTLNISQINFRTEGRSKDDKANEGEVAQLRSVIGSLSWIARQCRPDLSYMTNVLQTCIPHATLKDLEVANKVVEFAVESADIGLTYRNGILDWETSVIVSMSDASFGNETVNTPRGQEPHHSQQGRITMLVSPEVWKEDKAGMHIIGWNSTTIKRVCRSTLQAETFATLGAVEEGMRVRALIAESEGKLDLRNGNRARQS